MIMKYHNRQRIGTLVAVATALGLVPATAAPSQAQEVEPVTNREVAQQDKPEKSGVLARQATPIETSRWARQIIEGYPMEAIVRMQEGRVAVRLTIDPIGSVEACSVTQSSGHAILDNAACDAMIEYARFLPALDDNGEPTRGSWFTSVIYQL